MIPASRRAPAAAIFLTLGAVWGCDAPDTVREAGGALEEDGWANAAGPRDSFPLTIEDDAGRRVFLERAPRRVVALVPAATQVLVALDLEERLVGRTDFDRDPDLAALPSVGGGLGPSMERLVSLEPDLVVRFHAESDPDTPRRLDAAGIPHLAVRPDRIENLFGMIDLLGRAMGRPGPAEALERELTEELREVVHRVRDVTRPRAAYLLGGDPPLVAGGGTFLHELIEIAGAENVLADVTELYAPISVEELFGREIDVLFVTEGASIPGVLERIPIIRVPLEIESPGPHVGESARRLGRALHPDRFP